MTVIVNHIAQSRLITIVSITNDSNYFLLVELITQMVPAIFFIFFTLIIWPNIYRCRLVYTERFEKSKLCIFSSFHLPGICLRRKNRNAVLKIIKIVGIPGGKFGSLMARRTPRKVLYRLMFSTPNTRKWESLATKLTMRLTDESELEN